VIGPKKLSAIRQELNRALTATGDDPIRWLEERMTAPIRRDSPASSEVLGSLRRFLETTGREKGQRRRVGIKS